MLQTAIVRPDSATGEATYNLPKGTKYIHIPWTLPSLEIQVTGGVLPIKRIPAGGSGDIGFPTDLAGMDLPTGLNLKWPGAGAADSVGGVFSVAYGCVIVSSSFPIRTGGSQSTIEASIMDAFSGLTVTAIEAVTGTRQANRPIFAALDVAAKQAEYARFASVQVTPTVALPAGAWTPLGGVQLGASLPPTDDMSLARVTACDLSVNVLTGGPVDVMLTYYDLADSVGLGGLDLDPVQLSNIPALVNGDGFSQVYALLRPSVPPYAGTEMVIRRLTAVAVGDLCDLANTKPLPPMLQNFLPNTGFGMKVYARSSAGGSIAAVINWNWAQAHALAVL